MNTLVPHIEQSIALHRLWRDGQSVLVAVSGGLDSMVLLQVLHTLAGRHRWRLVVGHFNHRLRGTASDADAALVKRTARELGWPCAVEAGDVRRFARDNKLPLEVAARQLRHVFLAQTARRFRTRTIVLAHHADDQVELFFLRLLRGAGCEGLSGMKWQSPSPADPRFKLARPLLDQNKETLRAFALANQVSFREDASNMSPEFQRNRIRHELLPLLRARYQPAVRDVILRSMQMLGDTADFVSDEARHWLAPGNRQRFTGLPVAVQRAVLKDQLLRLRVEVDYELVERLRGTAGKPVMVGPELQASRDTHGFVTVKRLTPAAFSSAELAIDLQQRECTAVFHNVSIRWRFLSGSARPTQKAGREVFDADQVGPRIVLRHWRRGDRFQPIGLAQSVKLQDWFTNQKIGRERRHQLVIATTATGEIFWIEGGRIGDRFKVRSTTRRRIEWRWVRATANRE